MIYFEIVYCDYTVLTMKWKLAIRNLACRLHCALKLKTKLARATFSNARTWHSLARGRNRQSRLSKPLWSFVWSQNSWERYCAMGEWKTVLLLSVFVFRSTLIAILAGCSPLQCCVGYYSSSTVQHTLCIYCSS